MGSWWYQTLRKFLFANWNYTWFMFLHHRFLTLLSPLKFLESFISFLSGITTFLDPRRSQTFWYFKNSFSACSPCLSDIIIRSLQSMSSTLLEIVNSELIISLIPVFRSSGQSVVWIWDFKGTKHCFVKHLFFTVLMVLIRFPGAFSKHVHIDRNSVNSLSSSASFVWPRHKKSPFHFHLFWKCRMMRAS